MTLPTHTMMTTYEAKFNIHVYVRSRSSEGALKRNQGRHYAYHNEHQHTRETKTRMPCWPGGTRISENRTTPSSTYDDEFSFYTCMTDVNHTMWRSARLRIDCSAHNGLTWFIYWTVRMGRTRTQGREHNRFDDIVWRFIFNFDPILTYQISYNFQVNINSHWNLSI